MIPTQWTYSVGYLDLYILIGGVGFFPLLLWGHKSVAGLRDYTGLRTQTLTQWA